jgi:hypothetical protein
LSHTSSAFWSCYFGDDISQTCLGWPQTVILPISVSQVFSITIMSHQHPAWSSFCNSHVHSIFYFTFLPNINVDYTCTYIPTYVYIYPHIWMVILEWQVDWNERRVDW